MPWTFSLPSRVSYPDMHHGTCVTHVPWCMPGSLTSGFLWSRWQGKRSRHSRRIQPVILRIWQEALGSSLCDWRGVVARAWEWPLSIKSNRSKIYYRYQMVHFFSFVWLHPSCMHRVVLFSSISKLWNYNFWWILNNTVKMNYIQYRGPFLKTYFDSVWKLHAMFSSK